MAKSIRCWVTQYLRSKNYFHLMCTNVDGFLLICYQDEILEGSGIQKARWWTTILLDEKSQVSRFLSLFLIINSVLILTYGRYLTSRVVFICLGMTECNFHWCVLDAVGYYLLRSPLPWPSWNVRWSFIWKFDVCSKTIDHRQICSQPVESNYFYIYVEFVTGNNNIIKHFWLA